MARSEGDRYTAAGGIVADCGSVLVLRRPGRDEVRLPKGHVEPGETPEQAALRETCEESGYCDLVSLADLGTQQVEFEYRGRQLVRDEHYFLFGVRAGGALCDPEAQFEPLWLSWSDAEAALTFEAEREWIRRARRVGRAIEDSSGPAVALSTGSLYTHGISRVFDIASRLGYDGLEILVDSRWDTRDSGYLHSLASAHALPITSVHCPFAPEVAGWPADGLGRLRRTVALAHDLGARVVVAHLPVRFTRLVTAWLEGRPRRFSLPLPRLRPSPYERFLLDELAGFEQREAITVCVENMPARRFAGIQVNAFRHNRPSQLSDFGHITLDTTHLATWGLDPLDVYTRLRNRIAHVHISNYHAATRTGHHPPQNGDVDLTPFVQRLRRDQFPGQIVVEANPSTLQAADPAICEHRLRDALAFCRGEFAGGPDSE